VIFEYTIRVEKIHLLSIESDVEPTFEELALRVRQEDGNGFGSLSTQMNIIQESRRPSVDSSSRKG
jgi:hypothetical protein